MLRQDVTLNATITYNLLPLKLSNACFSWQLKRAGVRYTDRIFFYRSVIRSVLEYSCQLFHRNLPIIKKLPIPDEVERIQRRAMRIVFPDLKYIDALDKAGIPTLFTRRRESLLMTSLMKKTISLQNCCRLDQLRN